jgi:hypothetical protein
MDKYIVALTNNTSNVLNKRRITEFERRYLVIEDQMYRGDIYLADFDKLNDAEKFEASIY